MKRYVVCITFDGEYELIENNIDLIVDSIDFIGLRKAEVVIQNHGEIEE